MKRLLTYLFFVFSLGFIINLTNINLSHALFEKGICASNTYGSQIKVKYSYSGKCKDLGAFFISKNDYPSYQGKKYSGFDGSGANKKYGASISISSMMNSYRNDEVINKVYNNFEYYKKNRNYNFYIIDTTTFSIGKFKNGEFIADGKIDKKNLKFCADLFLSNEKGLRDGYFTDTDLCPLQTTYQIADKIKWDFSYSSNFSKVYYDQESFYITDDYYIFLGKKQTQIAKAESSQTQKKLGKDKYIVKITHCQDKDVVTNKFLQYSRASNFYRTKDCKSGYGNQNKRNISHKAALKLTYNQKFVNKKNKNHFNYCFKPNIGTIFSFNTDQYKFSPTFCSDNMAVTLEYDGSNYFYYDDKQSQFAMKETETKTQIAKAEPSQTKKKSTKIKEFKDLPDAEFYFYAFKDNKDFFIGYLNQDPKSKLIKIGNRKFREGNKGKAYTVNGNTCKVYSSVDKPNTKNRTYTGTATLDCKNNVKYVGNWVQYGPKGSGKGINENTGESIDFYFTMNRLTAIADLRYFKKGQKIKVAKIEQEESNQKEFKPKKTNQDKDPPIIEVAENITVSDSAYEIKGNVKDKSKKIFIEVDGQTIPVKKGKFKLKRFSPVDEQIKIVAIDQWGNRSKPKIVNVTIDIKNIEVAEKIEPLNPTKMRSRKNKDRIALIIGIEKYDQIPSASYANLDAKFFYEYARKGFGVSKSNIKLLIDEDADLVKSLGTLNKWLPGKIKSNQTELIIFFAGHGLASNDGKELYILPQDSDPDLLDRTALSRTELFKQIIDLNPKSVTMFMDTCYSGISRDEKMLLASARPVRISVNEEEGIPDNFTIFSASQLDQISSGIKEAKHGIFSYYLMKGLEGNADANKDKNITNGELLAYMDENVSQKASELGRQQNPSLAGDPNKVLMSYR